MAGETWDYERLREHIQAQLARIEALGAQRGEELRRELDQRFAAVRRELDQRFAAAHEATLKAEDATERRFESVNEFRASLADQEKLLLTRREYDAAHQTLAAATTEVARRLEAVSAVVVPRNETDAWRQGVSEKLEALGSRLDRLQGAGQGSEKARDTARLNINVVIAVIGLILSAAVVFAAIRH